MDPYFMRPWLYVPSQHRVSSVFVYVCVCVCVWAVACPFVRTSSSLTKKNGRFLHYQSRREGRKEDEGNITRNTTLDEPVLGGPCLSALCVLGSVLLLPSDHHKRCYDSCHPSTMLRLTWSAWT